MKLYINAMVNFSEFRVRNNSRFGSGGAFRGYLQRDGGVDGEEMAARNKREAQEPPLGVRPAISPVPSSC